MPGRQSFIQLPDRAINSATHPSGRSAVSLSECQLIQLPLRHSAASIFSLLFNQLSIRPAASLFSYLAAQLPSYLAILPSLRLSSYLAT